MSKSDRAPDWLADKLHSIGLKPINNVVDITNYVLHELGQPLQRVLMLAKSAGRFTCGQPRRTNNSSPWMEKPTICWRAIVSFRTDQAGPWRCGGVMGGLDSGISDTSTDVLLEAGLVYTSWNSPHFPPTRVDV